MLWLINFASCFLRVRYIIAAVMVVLLVCNVFWSHMKSALRFCLSGDIIGFDSGRPTFNWLGRLSQYRNHNFLFIFSDADDIIRADTVEKFAKFMEIEGNRVKRLRYTDSLHVSHYRKYPEEYVKAIRTFIQEVMSEGENLSHFPTQY